MRKPLSIGLAAAAGLALAQPAYGSVTLWNGSGSNDSVGWGQLGPSFTTVNSGTTATSVGGMVVTLTDSAPPMERRDEGSGWAGNFASGEQLLWNQLFGSITINFASPVSAAGAQIQSDTFGTFTARITMNDGTFFDLVGTSSNAGQDGNPFLGIISTTANITSITFNLTAPNQSFAISSLLMIDATSVPEPATWSMLLIGFGAMGFAVRRQRKPSPERAIA